MDPIRYQDLRGQIEDGWLLSFAGAWPESLGIRWWTNQEPGWRSWVSLAPISHVAFAVWQDYRKASRLCVLESVGGGPRMVPLSSLLRNYLSAGGKVYFQRPTHDKSSLVLEAALEMWGMGLRYPTEQYLAYLFGWYRYLHGEDVARDGVTCSEFCTAAVAKAGLWEDKKEPALTSPLELSESGLYELPRRGIIL